MTEARPSGPEAPAPIPVIPPIEQSILERVGDASLIALHGVAAVVSDVRLARAGNRMERMDHKDALYSDLGKIALGSIRADQGVIGPLQKGFTKHEFTAAETVSGKMAMPRTTVERFVDSRYARKARNKDNAHLAAYKAEAFHGASDDLRGMTKIEKFIGKNSASASEVGSPKSSMLVRDKVNRKGETKRVMIGRLGIRKERRQGKITASEAKILKYAVKGQPVKMGAENHKLASRSIRRETRRVKHAVDQRILKTWRGFRRDRAIGTIQKQHENAAIHREKKAKRIEDFKDQTVKRHETRRARRAALVERLNNRKTS